MAVRCPRSANSSTTGRENKMDPHKVMSHVNDLTNSLKALSADEDFAEFSTIIHKPGFTTVAEALFVTGLLESMKLHVQHLKTLKQSLLAGARAVGAK
jgi:hypothetical protein